MLYSRYYPPGTPPTTQEDQAKLAAEKVIPEPTTQEDQLNAAGYTQPALEVESTKTEPATQEAEDIPSGEVSAAIDARSSELVSSHTIAELREIAKQYGLDIPPRIKEETLAKAIATHEQGGK